MLRGLLGGVVAAPFVGAALIYSLADWNFGPEEDHYAFKMPVMFLQCLDFPIPAGDDVTIPSWRFEQGVRVDFSMIGTKTVRMPGWYYFGNTCGFDRANITFSTATTVNTLSIGPDKVQVDRWQEPPQRSLCIVPSTPIQSWYDADEKDCHRQGGTFTFPARH